MKYHILHEKKWERDDLSMLPRFSTFTLDILSDAGEPLCLCVDRPCGTNMSF